jgi:hypothetical protein
VEHEIVRIGTCSSARTNPYPVSGWHRRRSCCSLGCLHLREHLCAQLRLHTSGHGIRHTKANSCTKAADSCRTRRYKILWSPGRHRFLREVNAFAEWGIQRTWMRTCLPSEGARGHYRKSLVCTHCSLACNSMVNCMEYTGVVNTSMLGMETGVKSASYSNHASRTPTSEVWTVLFDMWRVRCS